MGRLREWVAASVAVVLLGGGVAVASTAQAAPDAARTEELSPEREATTAAAATGERIEVVASRTERQQVFANPDGSFTMELSLGPERVRRGNGWVDPDTRLVRRADGAIAPVAPATPVVFSGGGSAAPLARLSEGDRWIEMSWPDPLPPPQLSGETATYPEVLPGVDLQLTAHAEGFAPVLVVKTREAADNPRVAEIDFELSAQGLTVTEQPDGTLAARDEAGDVVFASSRVEMSDTPPPAAATTSEDEPTETVGVGNQAVGELELVGSDLTIVPDQALLDDPTTVYPVRIDPWWTAPQYGWAKVFAGKPDMAYWNGGMDGPEAKVGYCGFAGCNGIGTARSYFQFDTRALAGATLLGAELNIREIWAPSCAPAPLRLYRTNPIGQGMTWRRGQPGWGTSAEPWHLTTVSAAHGYGPSCPANWLGFDLGSNVVSPGGVTTFMLRADDEGTGASAQWKKFNSFANGRFAPRLLVKYNWPPDVPWQLSASASRMAPSLGCAGAVDQAFSPTGALALSAVLDDRDAQNLSAKFEWWQYGASAPAGSTQTAAQQPGLRHRAAIPAGVFGDGKRISWRVRAFDGVNWSGWSRFCQVTVDATNPGAPRLTSTDFPENGFGGYPGRTGAVTVTAADGDRDVLGFQWSLDFQDFPLVSLNSPRFVPAVNGVATIRVTPLSDGPHELYVRTVDRALNVSAPYRTPDDDGGGVPPGGGYHFLVGSDAPGQIGHWPLDGRIGAVPNNNAPDLTGGRPAAVSGMHPETGAMWRRGRIGDALEFTGAGSGYAATRERVLRTNQTFSVSTWATLGAVDTGTYAAVSQDGSVASGFYLGYVGDQKRFAFRMASADSTQAPIARAVSTREPIAGVWYHLAGVFDLSTRELRLYVNGALNTVARVDATWDAAGPLQIGRSRYRSQYTEPWRGRVDDVKVWQRALVPAEIRALANTPVIEEAFLPLDEGAGTRVGDVSGNYRNATATGGISWPPGPVGDHAIELDGVDDAVTGTEQAVRTDGSFSVTARARRDPEGTSTTQTVVSQDGPTASGFTLGYANGKWVFAVSPADGAAPIKAQADAEDCDPGPSGGCYWVDLAGVYDAAAGEVRLYVEGVETVAVGGVRAHVPGPLTIGRAKSAGQATAFFDGRVDDVHVYTGVLSKELIVDHNESQVTARPNPYGGQLSRFVNHDGRHFVSTGPVPPAMLWEPGLGLLAPPDTPGTRMLYSCRYSGGWYMAVVDTCEGTDKTLLGEIGLAYKNPPPDHPSLPIYRCVVPATGDHYSTPYQACEDPLHRNEGLLGYTLAYRQLVRYVSDAPGHDHLTVGTLARLPAGYQPEGTQGIIALTGDSGANALYSCVDGTDEFLSTDPACEGKTVRRREGGIWTQPPAFAAATAPLYSCRLSEAEGGDRFTSLDEQCEGRTTQASRLGYVITSLH
ncbi:LamG-like jellyroll fold domain-containing protein [Micromonospora sp. NPDC052213]|uniref:LamG-like jellyroll fold domain-containing protein n=1 Tax=Micromonospora sp. NPDC052213 TaxID=3155812 RepID=UPI00344444F8